MQRSAIVVIIPLLLWIVTGQASAHAFLDHAEPRVGNTVDSTPDVMASPNGNPLIAAACN